MRRLSFRIEYRPMRHNVARNRFSVRVILVLATVLSVVVPFRLRSAVGLVSDSSEVNGLLDTAPAVVGERSANTDNASSVIQTSNHTIIIDGTNDFASDEDVPGSSGSTWYFSWDATNFYFGINGSPDVGGGSSTKWVVLNIDSDPDGANGSNAGVLYNTQQPTLPFKADFQYRWKTDGTYANMLDWNNGTSSWTDDNTGNNN